jgi:hypothetical protein
MVDKSISMAGSEPQVTEALRGFANTLQSASGQLRYLGTLVVFAGEPETIVLSQPLEKLAIDYRADGEGTAIFDALAYALPLEKSRTEPVICAIVSDGEENSSQEADERLVAAMIAARREMGWTFLWLSLNGKSNRTARTLSIPCITTTRENIRQALPEVVKKIASTAARLVGTIPLRAIEGGRR